MCGFAYAKSDCSGVGGVAEWRKYAMQIFVMELHHRGSKMVYHTPVPPQQRYLLSFIDLHFSRMRFCISHCRTIRLP